MNIRQFKRNINMGLGSAIIALKNGVDKDDLRYRDAVLYACLHNTCYDAQCESGRDHYLFEAISLIGELDFFEDRIIDRLNRTADFYLNGQLSSLLFLFWKNKSKKAADALQKRLDTLIAKLPYITRYSGRGTPRENAERIAMWLMEIYGIQSFFDTARKFGSILMRSKKTNVIWYDWFLDNAKSKFGEERIYNGLEKESAKCAEIKRFLDEINMEAERQKIRIKNRVSDQINMQDLIDAAENNRAIAFWGYGRRLAKIASAEELTEIAAKIDTADNPRVKTALLRVFQNVDYPHSVDRLLAIYYGGNDDVKEAALEALARFKHKRIHELALHNLQRKLHVSESLGLLEKNFKDEYEIILNVLKSHRDSEEYDYHSLAMRIRKIFNNRRNPKAQGILLFDYHRNRCSACREHIVEIMCKSKCIPPDILEECLYDCCEDTRKRAAGYKKMLLKTSP